MCVCVSIHYVRTTRLLIYIQIFMLKSILSAWPATTHQISNDHSRKAWGSYDNKRRKNVSRHRIWPLELWCLCFDQLFICCGTHIYAGCMFHEYICNHMHVIEDLHILYQPVSQGYGTVITYTELMTSRDFSCIWLFSRFLLYMVERNMCSCYPIFDEICFKY